jgi:hypothetical protein
LASLCFMILFNRSTVDSLTAMVVISGIISYRLYYIFKRGLEVGRPSDQDERIQCRMPSARNAGLSLALSAGFANPER